MLKQLAQAEKKPNKSNCARYRTERTHTSQQMIDYRVYIVSRLCWEKQ